LDGSRPCASDKHLVKDQLALCLSALTKVDCAPITFGWLPQPMAGANAGPGSNSISPGIIATDGQAELPSATGGVMRTMISASAAGRRRFCSGAVSAGSLARWMAKADTMTLRASGLGGPI
jgi:hypothetical protein